MWYLPAETTQSDVSCVRHISSRREVGRVSCGRCAKKAPAKKKAATKKKK
jgi:hypothetical protein